MLKSAENKKLELIIQKSDSPEEELRNISMIDSTNDQLDFVKTSQNVLEPWVKGIEKKSQTPIQRQKRLGFSRYNKRYLEKPINQTATSLSKTTALNSYDIYNKKSRVFIIRSKDKTNRKNFHSINIEQGFSFRCKTPKITQMNSTIDSLLQENISNTENLKNSCLRILSNDYYQNCFQKFVPMKKTVRDIKKLQIEHLSEFYTSIKDEIMLEPVETFVYPTSINNTKAQQNKKDNKKMARFEFFVNSQKNNGNFDQKKRRKLSLKNN